MPTYKSIYYNLSHSKIKYNNELIKKIIYYMLFHVYNVYNKYFNLVYNFNKLTDLIYRVCIFSIHLWQY